MTSRAGATPRLDADFVERALGPRLRARCGPNRELVGASIDSRSVQAGELFVALAGERADGHDFVLDAVGRGAAGVLISRDVPGFDAESAPETAVFHVDDTLAALQHLGAAWRSALTDVDVVGITGNVGKTTTRAFAASVLGSVFRVRASTGSFNNEIGVPVTLLSLTPDTECAVLEMGMYTKGDIALLCEWARPRIGVVLNVGPVHLERAGSMQAIVEAKREMVEALPADGHALLNIDDTDVRGMASHTAAHVWTFGTDAAADVRGSDVARRGAAGFDFTLTFEGASRRVSMGVPGTHLLSNALAAAAIGLVKGMSLDAVAAALEALRDTPRVRFVRLASGATVLDDTYNANPASMEAALDLLAEMPGRRFALLGDMRELGPLAEESHVRIGQRAAEVVDALYTVGELARDLSNAARAAGLERTQHLDGVEVAADILRASLHDGDVLLVKGSRALALERVVAALEGPSAGGADA
ncbi:MAG: UDP-N-acetylmuramoyl-tripeptide--D-alanyl-D-alanine ligase [Dehalococcoidia bacterium]